MRHFVTYLVVLLMIAGSGIALSKSSKVAQAGNGFLGAAQGVESKVELLAAGNTEQEIADRRG